MLITISGQSGSGKNSTAERLARKLRCRVVDAGTIFRDMGKKQGMDVIAFGQYVDAHPEIDQALDEEMLRHAQNSTNVILLGRLTGWMTMRRDIPAVRVWLSATAETRAKRVVRREKISFQQALQDTERRDRDNALRYKKLYGLDLNDLSPYDIVVVTDNRSLGQVVSLLSSRIPKIWLKIRQKQTPPPPKRSLNR